MTRTAILHPTTLLGQELRRLLEHRPERFGELRLLTTEKEEIGTLLGVGGAATVVVRGEPEELAGLDLVFLCGSMEESRPFLDRLPAGVTTVILSPDAPPGSGAPVVAGINPSRAQPGSRVVSPHPAVVLLSLLLQPLVPLGLREASATVIQPTSLWGSRGLDDLFEQTRGILAMQGARPGLFGRQLAFNVLPARIPGEWLAAQVAEVLETTLPISVLPLQGAVFHGLAASLHLRLDPAVDPVEVDEALGAAPLLERVEEPETLGPIDATDATRVLVGDVTTERPGSLKLWAVLDNLTRGGAANALEVAEGLV